MTRHPTRGSVASRAAARGYTFIELLMAMLIFSIGVTGVIAMQKVTVTSNQHARDLAIATQIAQAWLDQLRTDALSWNDPSAVKPGQSDLADTVWLGSVASTNTAWTLPVWSDARKFGPAFDSRGNAINPASPVNPDNPANPAPSIKFCTHIRLSWLYQPGADVSNVTGDGLIRAEVRVFWLREGQPLPGGTNPICSAQVQPASVGADTSRYHFVYTVSAVRENTEQ